MKNRMDPVHLVHPVKNHPATRKRRRTPNIQQGMSNVEGRPVKGDALRSQVCWTP